MLLDSSHTLLYDRQGNLLGVFIPAEIWNKTKHKLAPVLSSAQTKPERAVIEPLQDWELLKLNWDFKYPFTAEAQCSCCGAATENWEADVPRKFTLEACNLGGLVRLRCNSCKATLLKRHFKDKIQVTCTAEQSQQKTPS